jgi:hypothetical protein
MVTIGPNFIASSERANAQPIGASYSVSVTLGAILGHNANAIVRNRLIRFQAFLRSWRLVYQSHFNRR